MSRKKPSAKEIYEETFGHLKEFDCISKLMFTKQFPGCNGALDRIEVAEDLADFHNQLVDTFALGCKKKCDLFMGAS